MIGIPISITSKRKQTTKDCILGVNNNANSQLIFVDTPGIELINKKFDRNRKLNSLATSIFDQVDLILWVIEAKKFTFDDKKISHLLPSKKPIIVAINKIDLATNAVEKNKIFEQIHLFSNVKYSAIVPISIHKTYQISQLIKEIENNLPIQSKIYDSNFLTDKSLTFRACEIIREKTLRLVGDELPYKINVHMDRFIEKNVNQKYYLLDVSIIVTKPSHKPIIIGKKANTIKRIRIDSQRSLVKLFSSDVRLSLWVKIRNKYLTNLE